MHRYVQERNMRTLFLYFLLLQFPSLNSRMEIEYDIYEL